MRRSCQPSCSFLPPLDSGFRPGQSRLVRLCHSIASLHPAVDAQLAIIGLAFLGVCTLHAYTVAAH